MTANVSVELLELWIDHSKYDGCSDGDADCLSAQKLLEAIQSGTLTAPAEVNAEGLPKEVLDALSELKDLYQALGEYEHAQAINVNPIASDGLRKRIHGIHQEIAGLASIALPYITRANDGGRGGWVAALKGLSLDMHTPSMRPCPTCKKLTDLLGFQFGCYEYQAKRNAKPPEGK